MSEQRRTRVGAYALCQNAKGQVLLCRMAGGKEQAGCWTLPGGGIDFGEAPAAAALRELEEEAGLAGEVTDLALIDSTVFGPRPERPGEVHAISLVYRVKVTSGTPRDELDGSTDTCAWFSRADARALPLFHLGELALNIG